VCSGRLRGWNRTASEPEGIKNLHCSGLVCIADGLAFGYEIELVAVIVMEGVQDHFWPYPIQPSIDEHLETPAASVKGDGILPIDRLPAKAVLKTLISNVSRDHDREKDGVLVHLLRSTGAVA
jgi:hypothetical protein